MKYRKSFRYLGWSLIGIYLLLLLLQIPQGFEHTNWLGLILVAAGWFLIAFVFTKSSYLTLEGNDVIHAYGFVIRHKIPTDSIVRVVKGANTGLGESFGKITYLFYRTPAGEKFIRLYVGFTNDVLRGFLSDLIKKNPRVELDDELAGLMHLKHLDTKRPWWTPL